jgi:hypothetical protein
MQNVNKKFNQNLSIIFADKKHPYDATVIQTHDCGIRAVECVYTWELTGAVIGLNVFVDAVIFLSQIRV